MFFAFIVVFIYACMFEECASNNVEIGHYPNVTLESCGLRQLILPSKSCFEWHQSIREQLEHTKRIQYGAYAQTGEFPFTVYITLKTLKGQSGSCTGSIINEKWILTAAHCLANVAKSKDIKVYVGFTEFPRDLSHNFIEAYQTFSHPDYSKPNFLDIENDIGLIKLKTAIQIRDEVNSICLPSTKLYAIYNPDVVTFTGWGYLDDTHSNFYKLKKTQIKVEKFTKEYTIIFSFKTIDGILCNGDSGGPLFTYINGRAVLIGALVSTNVASVPCGKVKTTKFVSAFHHINWIRETIIKNK